MRQFPLLFLLFGWLCFGTAFGQTQVRPQPGNFSPIAGSYQQLTSLSAATAPTIPTGAVIAVICVETQAIRYRDDGTDPTASVGMPVAAGNCIQTVTNVLALTKFIEQTASAKINISYYRNN